MNIAFSRLFSISASVIGLSVLLAPNVSSGQGIAAAMGKAEYTRSCASCHGPEGAGNGPMADQLTTPPANLQMLGNKYSISQWYEVIDGRKTFRAHGTSDMPIWGDAYAGIAKEMGGKEKAPSQVEIEQDINGRILSLIYYLQTIQK